MLLAAVRDIMRMVTMQAQNSDNACAGAYQKYMELISGCLFRGWQIYHISPRGFNGIRHANFTHIDIHETRFRPVFLLYSLQVLVKLFLLGRKNKIDAVLVFSPLEGLIGLLYRFFNRGIKVIVAFHGDQIAGIKINNKPGVRSKLNIHILNAVEKFVVNYSDLLIFVSEYDRDNVLGRTKSHSANKAIVVYNNINTPRVARLSEDSIIDVGNGHNTIGFVGHIYENGKGLGCLIESFAVVRKKFPGTKLVIIGSGPDELRLAKLVKDLGLQDSVIFPGYQANPLRYMKGFDLLVLPSLHEGFPLVILEALYVGTPVIASNVGGIPELLKYDELLFKPNDREQLASKIIEIFQSKAKYDHICGLCKARRERFEFNWADEMAEAIE